MGEFTAIPTYNIQSVSESLRQLANLIDDGSVDANRCVVVIEGFNGKIDYRAFGKDFTKAHAAGICFAATNKIIT